MSKDKLAEIRVLAVRLQNAAYDHGGIDASDRWSAKKYADADDRSRASLTTLMDKVSEALQAHAADAYAKQHEALQGWVQRATDAEAELAEAQNTIASQQGTMGALKRKLALAEGELAALKARIAEAPVAYLTSKTGVGTCNVASMVHGVVFDSSSYGKSLRVVLDE